MRTSAKGQRGRVEHIRYAVQRMAYINSSGRVTKLSTTQLLGTFCIDLCRSWASNDPSWCALPQSHITRGGGFNTGCIASNLLGDDDGLFVAWRTVGSHKNASPAGSGTPSSGP